MNFMEFKAQLKNFNDELKKILPYYISVDTFERITLTAVNKNQALLSCDRNSLFNALSLCACDGLIPNDKEAALVKVGSKVSYMPMISGILKKIKQSKEIVFITAHIVYECDQFSFYIDEFGEHLHHNPNFESEKIFKLVYALAKTIDGATFIEVMSKEEIEKIKNFSKMGSVGAWKNWYSEMAKKSVLRRLAKRLPLSKESEDVILREDENFDFNEIPKKDKILSLLESKNDKIDLSNQDHNE